MKFNPESIQAIFDANYLMQTGMLAYHWTDEARKEWMGKHPALPWRIHIGCNCPEAGIFTMQMVNTLDGKAHASFSLGSKQGELGNGCYVSPALPHIRLSMLEKMALEVSKKENGRAIA